MSTNNKLETQETPVVLTAEVAGPAPKHPASTRHGAGDKPNYPALAVLPRALL